MLDTLGKNTLPNVSVSPISKRADGCAGDRADAAEHHHDEGQDQHAVAHAGKHRGDRRNDDAAERRQRDADREHVAVDLIELDAEHARHLAVLGAGAHDHADLGAGDDQEDHGGDDQAEHADRQPVDRIGQIVGELDRARQPSRRRAPRARPCRTATACTSSITRIRPND